MLDFTKHFPPMLCQKGSPTDSENHIFEAKLDGERTLILFDRKRGYFRLQNRESYDRTKIFPEFADMPKWLKCDSCILDGELVINEGRTKDYHNTNFKTRIHIQSHIRANFLAKLNPLTYYIFDIAFLNGENLMNKTLMERKELLKEVIKENERIKILPSFTENGTAIYEMLLEQGFEGIIIKAKNSRYVNERSFDWIKVKPQHKLEVAIVGYNEGEKGSHREELGSFIIQHNGEDVGEVGSGLSQKDIDFYFRNKPKKCLIKFQEKLASGKLRFPVFLKFL